MIYITAAEIIEKAKNKEGSIKSLVYSSDSKEIKQLYALVCETLKYSSVIQQILAAATLLQQEKWLKESVAEVLTYDLLFGKGVKCRGKFKRIMKKHSPSLEKTLEEVKKAANVTRNKDLLSKSTREAVVLPRYIRVNRLKQTTKGVEDAFKEDGYECVLSREEADEQMRTTDPLINSTQCIHLIKNLQPKQFMADLDLNDVFVFAPGTDLHSHRMFKSREIVLQDKASCIPAAVLAPPPGSHVIDSCAAPGNKTSQLASIMGNTGQIFAYDCTPNRYRTLCKLVPKSGVSNATFANLDFLKTNPDDASLSEVEYILVDPSCSGSGMVDRKDYLTNSNDTDQARLINLAKVQLTLLNHALSFPNVKRVVYSTCSVHAEENEKVVMKALAENTEFELKRVHPLWGQSQTGNRKSGDDGAAEDDPKIRRINSLCLHAVAKENLTNGFFVALFEKKSAFGDDGEKEKMEKRQGDKKKTPKKRKHQKDGGDHQNGGGVDQEESQPMNIRDMIKSMKKKRSSLEEGVKQESNAEAAAEDSVGQDMPVVGTPSMPVVDTSSKVKSTKKNRKKRKSLAK